MFTAYLFAVITRRPSTWKCGGRAVVSSRRNSDKVSGLTSVSRLPVPSQQTILLFSGAPHFPSAPRRPAKPCPWNEYPLFDGLCDVINVRRAGLAKSACHLTARNGLRTNRNIEVVIPLHVSQQLHLHYTVLRNFNPQVSDAARKQKKIR